MKSVSWHTYSSKNRFYWSSWSFLYHKCLQYVNNQLEHFFNEVPLIGISKIKQPFIYSRIFVEDPIYKVIRLLLPIQHKDYTLIIYLLICITCIGSYRIASKLRVTSIETHTYLLHICMYLCMYVYYIIFT